MKFLFIHYTITIRKKNLEKRLNSVRMVTATTNPCHSSCCLDLTGKVSSELMHEAFSIEILFLCQLSSSPVFSYTPGRAESRVLCV